VTEYADGITVVIPSIPPRSHLLKRALRSVENQIKAPVEVITPLDTEHLGAGPNRNRGLFDSKTKWTAFLDDDDEFLPNHLNLLYDFACLTDADLVYPWFEVIGGTDPLAVEVGGNLRTPFGLSFGENEKQYILNTANFIPITYLVNTEKAQSVGGYPDINTEEWPMDNCEDWGFLKKMLRADSKFVHAPEITWHWHHHGANTSGLASRW